MNRVREGKVISYNPFTGHPYQVSLLPEEVIAFVFWSKDPRPLLPHLDEIERSYQYYLHFTITGLPRPFETDVPPPELTIPAFKSLSRRRSPRHLQWRYDPIVLSSITDPDWHRENFRKLAYQLEGYTERCYLSFVAEYAKVSRSFASLEGASSIVIDRRGEEEKISLAHDLAGIALEHGITTFACCNDLLLSPDSSVRKAHCIDGELLARLFPEKERVTRVAPTRKECGCTISRDIGSYQTCPHGCIYCYANNDKEKARQNFLRHDPDHPFLQPERSRAPGTCSAKGCPDTQFLEVSS